MAAFGDELRRQREARGLAVDAICRTTKFPAKHVHALEAGALAELPGGVFRRGLVRSYLAALGLDEGSWMQRFDETCREHGLLDTPETDWAAFARNVGRGRSMAGPRTGRGLLRIVLILLFLGMTSWCGWRLATHRTLVPGWHPRGGLKSWVDNGASR